MNVKHIHTSVFSTVIPRIPSFLTDWSRYTKSSPMCGDSEHFSEVVTVDEESPEWHRGLFLGCRTHSSSSEQASLICIKQQKVQIWNSKMITFDIIFNRYSETVFLFVINDNEWKTICNKLQFKMFCVLIQKSSDSVIDFACILLKLSHLQIFWHLKIMPKLYSQRCASLYINSYPRYNLMQLMHTPWNPTDILIHIYQWYTHGSPKECYMMS